MAHPADRTPTSPEADWERRVRTRLNGSDADAERVLELARDIERVVAGDLSEEEFQARYCEDQSSRVR